LARATAGGKLAPNHVSTRKERTMTVAIDQSGLRELDQRRGDGFEVTLLWSVRTGAIFVCVEDEGAGTGFHFAVDGTLALDAFRHPYAYAGDSADSGHAPVGARG
jgi:hypothetical protein